MSALGSDVSRPSPTANAVAWGALRTTAARLCLLGFAGCSSAGSAAPTMAQGAQTAPDSPLVAAQPGAWFDPQGNLNVVGAGRRLRLVLSAPILACNAASKGAGAPDASTRTGVPFHVVSEACRNNHPTILLADESETASPAELERSYHEVEHCAASDWGLTEGWVPRVIEESDPCPLALGLGWRLPTTAELQGLTVDDRKALAGALFDTEDRTASAGLLVYARGSSGLSLVTLSPNASEQAPVLTDEKRERPWFGAALRCTRAASVEPGPHAPPPVLPHASECLNAQRKAQGLSPEPPSAAASPELDKLRAWIELTKRAPKLLSNEAQLQDLSRILASSGIERMARDAREERALTEHYSELAEGLDDPSVSAGERERRHAEFDNLRRRLGGQLVQKAEGGADRTQLAALLAHLQSMLEEAAAKQSKGTKKSARFDYRPLLARVRELGSGKALTP